MQSFPLGNGRAWEVHLRNDVRYPSRLTTRPDAPRQSNAVFKRPLTRGALERGCRRRPNMKYASAFQYGCVTIQLPDGADLPAQCPANVLNDSRRRLSERGRLGQDLSN